MSKSLSYLKTFFAFFIWSFVGVVFNKSSFNAFQNVFLISLLSILWFLLVAAFKKQFSSFKRVKPTGLLIIFAAISGVAGTMWMLSLTIMPIAPALFLLSSLPIFALLLEIFFFKEKTKFLQILAIGTGVLGIFILVFNGIFVHNGYFSPLASFLVLTSAFLFAVQGFIIKKLGSRYPFEMTMLWLMLGQGLVSSLFAFRSPWKFDYYSFGATFLLSIFSSLIAYYFYIEALKYLRVSTVRLIGYIEPLFGSLWGVVFLSQSFLPFMGIGGFFILLASYIAVKYES